MLYNSVNPLLTRKRQEANTIAGEYNTMTKLTIVSATRRARPEQMRDSQKREITLAVMKRPLTFDELCRKLGIKLTDSPMLKKKVRVMRREGIVVTRKAA